MENIESQLSVKHLRALYYQYKGTIMYSLAISCLILLANIFLYIWVVQPQYNLWQENRQKIAETNDKIEKLKKNIQILSTQDFNTLTQNFQLAHAALPSEQDFVGIMLAISSAATNAGISLETYNFKLGNLKSQQKLLPVNVSIDVQGNGDSLKKFLQEIHQKLPLANLNAIDGADGSTKVVVNFFSKSLADVHFTEDMATADLPIPSKKDTDILTNLTAWQQTLQTVSEEDFSASSSSDVSPF